MMLVFLIIGFLLGTRAKQILASVKVVGTVMRKGFSLKVPASLSIMGDKQVADDGAGDDADQQEEEEEEEPSLLDQYIQPLEADPELADHPDVQISPVILYNIKKVKEELRLAQRKAALLADGLDEKEVEERMAMEASSGGGGGGGRMNALALLISVGARVEATSGSGNAEHVATMDRRRMQRNVDAYLQKAAGVEKFRSEKTARDPLGGRLKVAHEVAHETKLRRVGGEEYERAMANLKKAKEARAIYKSYQSKQPTWQGASDDPGVMKRDRNANAGLANQTDMLAALQAEVEAEEGDEGEEGEEGEEGDSEDLGA